MRLPAYIVVLLACALTACGTTTRAAEPAPGDTSASPAAAVDLPPVVAWDGSGYAPPVTVVVDGSPTPSPVWTSCYDGTCADGAPGRDLVDLGGPAAVAFSFPDPGWTFTAGFHEAVAQGDCDRTYPGEVETTGPHTFVARPAGPPGRYRVDLFGRGPDGGDVVTSVLWSTAATGPLPSPSGRLSLLTDHDGELDTYGLELNLRDLPTDRPQVRATVTVTSADGAALTLPPVVGRGRCYDQGAVFVDRERGFTAELLALGPGPYAYRVDLGLDGTSYVGTATYPDDLVPDEEPAVALTFDPPLPALAPGG